MFWSLLRNSRLWPPASAGREREEAVRWPAIQFCTGAVVLVLLGILLNSLLVLELEREEVFGQYNVLFDADPGTRIQCFSEGRGGWGRSIPHPNLCNLVYPPVWLTAKLAVVSGISQDEQATRRLIALGIAPLASGLSAATLFFAGVLLGLGGLRSFLLGLMAVVSFSQLVFGSIPDHFALGGLGIALVMLLVAMESRGRAPPKLAWIGVGWFAASITITNVLPVAAAYGLCQLRVLSWHGALGRTTVLLGITLLLVFSLKGSIDLVFGDGRLPVTREHVEDTTQWAHAFLEQETRKKISAFPVALTQAIAPAMVASREIDMRPTWSKATVEAMQQARHQRMLIVPDLGRVTGSQVIVRSVAGLALLAYLLAMSMRYRATREDPAALVAVCSLAICGFNWLLHGFWGNEYFLYSQHWLAASLVPIAMICSSSRLRYSHSVTIMALLVACVALANAHWIRVVFGMLGSDSGQ